MRISIPYIGRSSWFRTRDLAGPIICWSVWAAMTFGMVFYVRHYTRNIPYGDDMALVPMMTGNLPVTLDWLWSQHNEHRPVISRLILTGLTRFVRNDFRTGLYFNVSVMSVGAGMMLLLARRLRGSHSVTDSVLPLSILNVSQADCLVMAFALNLVLSAWISYELIATASLAVWRPGWSLALRFGLCLVLLPLCGGSGLVLLPTLMVWLIGYVCWGWWSGREPGGAARAIGMAMLMACSAIVTIYMSGYVKPAQHPIAPSIVTAASTTMECLALVIYPCVGDFWLFAGFAVVLLSFTTLVRLAVAAVRAPDERPRASGLIAMILSMLGTAAAVGLSRSGLGPGAGRATRYITLMAPLLSALYFAWLAYGSARARRVVHVGLLVLLGLLLPANVRHGMQIGGGVRAAERRVVSNLKARVPGSRLTSRASSDIFCAQAVMYESFKMLKAAGIGPFADFVDDKVAAASKIPTAVRR
jgi:hypothetical protein